MKSIAVFCGSQKGNDSLLQEKTQELADHMVQKKIKLIYGGASVGLMGLLADAILQKGGQVIGIITHALSEKEIAHSQITKMYTVDSLQERKQKMFELADGFLLLPGGLGSLDEYFEIITCAQLNYHHKPCGIYNINSFYHFLIQHINLCVEKGFISRACQKSLIYHSENIVDLFEMFHKHFMQFQRQDLNLKLYKN